MQTFLGILQLLLVLQRVPAQVTPPPIGYSLFFFLFIFPFKVRCSCQVMDQLVYVYDEYPQSVENIYVPHCVVVRRCSGYCSGEEFKCLPTLERNATLQVNQPMVELTFLEHQQCQCRSFTDNLIFLLNTKSKIISYATADF
uniref:Platelet-derived growth factor (PDGF) family profile domain-containing protein n=1 Tax=Neolamprologus brichardi TaxID=32507 RepID=A0A3Q4IB17_NEOBR